MARPPTYLFEALTPDLSRPPMAAQRALISAGLILNPEGWAHLPPEARHQLVAEGARDIVDAKVVTAFIRGTPVRHVKYISKLVEPGADQMPVEVMKALFPARRITGRDWASLRALDRYVLAALATNRRLLSRAAAEILPHLGTESLGASVVGRAEVRTRRDALVVVNSDRFMGGNAFHLARAAGLRVARRAHETFDVHAERSVGPVELDFAVLPAEHIVLVQAHASSWDGQFFPAASLVAASTAAVALVDMLRGLDPSVALQCVALREEPWSVGQEDDYHDEPTLMYSGTNEVPNTGELLRTLKQRSG